MKAKFSFSHRRTHVPTGLSLIEMVIVLALSSMLVAGSLAWFGSKRSTDFYDQMRQIQSSINEVQSQISSNLVPGYTANSDCNGNRGVGTTCPLADNEQVLATSVAMDLAAPRTIQVKYFKASPRSTSDPTLTSVSSYGSGQNITLPVGLHLAAVKSYSRTTGVPCSVGNQLSADSPTLGLGGISATGTSLVSFRRSPSVMNSFVTGGTSDIGVYADWGGDNPLGLNTIPDSLPCAVVWAFESDEQVTVAGASQARFKGEYVFDLSNQTMRLQTH